MLNSIITPNFRVPGPGIVERRLDQSAPLAANEDRQSSLQRPKWNIAQQENPR